MPADRVFLVCNTAILPCWLLLLAAPRWRWTPRVTTFAATLVLAAVYAWLLATSPPSPGASFNTLAGVRALFVPDNALAAGWLHYLAFDLFLGTWESEDAARLGISRWLVLPFQLLTFVFGPAGLAGYLLLRAGMRRRFGLSLAEGA